MDRKKIIEDSEIEPFYRQFQLLKQKLDTAFQLQYDRSLPFEEEMFDRWERAKTLGFGEGTSIYESAFVFGKISVGKKCWIGPYTIIDGSGGLRIGDHCTISSGVHIYTHDNVKQTLSGGKIEIEKDEVVIGNNTYVGPQSIIGKGITIGNFCIVAANSFVNKTYEDYSIIAGNPAKQIGTVIIENDQITYKYFER